MRGILTRQPVLIALLALLLAPVAASAQQDVFHWVDFHSEKDQPVITWVTRTLDPYKWTEIREIGVVYDAALVVTTDRPTATASPAEDTFQVWSVSLGKHMATPVLQGVHLQWLDWLQLAQGRPREIAAVYRGCDGCAATTYFTTFHYDISQHLIVPRWMRGSEAAPVWSSASPQGVQLSQAYGVLADPNGDEFLATWNHLDYGKQRAAEDYLYRYDLDPFSGLERTQLVSGKEVVPLEQRICAIQGEPAAMARGQDSSLCWNTAPTRPPRHPVTTPPANNQGRSTPPVTRHKR